MYFSKIKTLFCFFTLFAFCLTFKCVRLFRLNLYIVFKPLLIFWIPFTMELRLTTTSITRPPCYHDHFGVVPIRATSMIFHLENNTTRLFRSLDFGLVGNQLTDIFKTKFNLRQNELVNKVRARTKRRVHYNRNRMIWAQCTLWSHCYMLR